MKHLITLICLFFCVITSSAQDKDIKRPDTYNYTRGVEAIQQENYKEAFEYLNKEIEENPKNGYAYAWIAAIRENYQEYGRAITALDLALKYLPKKDKTYRTWVYTSKADVYKELDEYDKAYECMSLPSRIEVFNEWGLWSQMVSRVLTPLLGKDSPAHSCSVVLPI